MICFPNAKINLGLYVTEKRSDGMHNIETCMVPIPLFDILEILPASKFSIEHYGIPIPGLYNNLIDKAWNLLLSVRKNIQPVKVCLYKNIPVGAGLGGGSSNAAFFLKQMNNSFNLGFTESNLELMAANIGADCPFFMRNKTILASGIGNKFTPINNHVSGMFVTVIFPEIHISTKEAFINMEVQKSTNLDKALGLNISKWKDCVKNDFEKTVLQEYPEIGKIKELLYNLGATYSSLTGSGSAVYALSTKPLNINKLANMYAIWYGIIG
jgi:4-diphosphocytidyl-2-C-methyl-D-erythritol kinase